MRKSFKILTILFALILLCGIVTVSAMASEDETASTPPDGYYFQVYDIASKTTTKYNNPEQFNSIIAGLKKDSIITLLWNIEDTNSYTDSSGAYKDSIIYAGNGASETDPVKIYWDLNGYYYSFLRQAEQGNAVSFDVMDYVELNVYSSRPGGKIFNYHKSGAAEQNALFWLRYSNAILNLGYVEVPVEFNHNDRTYTDEKPVTYDGDNLYASGGALIGLIHNGTNDKNLKVNINGGTYTHNAGAAALIVSTADETGEATPIINIENATLISNYAYIINISKAVGGNDPTANVSFKNCLFYSTAQNVIGGCASTATLAFDNCRFAGKVGNINPNSSVTVNNCMFANEATYSTTETEVRTFYTEEIPLYTHSFAYNSDGTVKPSSYTNPSLTNVLFEYNFITAKEGEYTTVTWDASATLGKTHTEKWFNDAVPTPYPSFIIAQTDAYKYVFVKEGDTSTYILKGYAAFDIKANLNLSDKFTFNIYIPKDICDNDINKLFIDKDEIENFKDNEITIDGEDYYIVSKSIPASEANESFTFSIDIKGYNGKSLIQEYTFSVSSYIEKVISGNYGGKAQALATATKNYISALENYIKDSEIGEISSYTPKKNGSMSPVIASIKTARLMFKETITFRFYSDSAPEITLTLPTSDENGKIITKNEAGKWETVTDNEELEDGKYYCEVILPVKFLNQGVTVTVGENSGTFYLDDYISYAQTELKDNSKLVNLVNSIGNYCKAALEFADANSGNQSPTVDFKINGESIDKIVYDNDTLAAAEKLKTDIEAKTKTELTLVSKEVAGEVINNAVILSLVSPDVYYDSRVSVDGDNLLINFSLKSFIAEAVDIFAKEFINHKDTDISFSSSDRKDYFTDKLYYSDFGAAGDGATEDFFNLKAAHDHANETKRHTVYAESGKTYYIHETRVGGTGNTPQIITIKTNVIWGDAKFIIDDHDLSTFDGTKRHNNNIFNVVSDYDDITVTDAAKLTPLAGVGEDTEKLALGLGYPAMITIYNEKHTVYRRSGKQDAGQAQREVILIDEYGNIDESTPFMFDYTEVTKYVVHRTDVEPVTISGGIFTTVASSVNIYDEEYFTENEKYKGDGYILRGINVSRPYTVLSGVEHYVTGEIPLNKQTATYCGVAYNGFFYATSTNDVLFKDCVLTGRRCYTKKVGGTMGTYDFGAKMVNKIRLEGCIQSNFYLQASKDMGITTSYKQINPDGSVTYGVEVEENGIKEKKPGFTVKMEGEIPKAEPVDGTVFSMDTNPSYGVRICWGIGGTNWCKNMAYVNSVLSRFDAHCGLLNGEVTGTTINFFAMVGKGDFLIEDTTWIAPASGAANNSMIYLRDDYGSPWEGTITIKDTVAVNHKNGDTISDFGLVFHKYTNADFGYICHFPNIVIDNLQFTNFDNSAKVNLIYKDCAVISKDIHLETYGGSNANPVVPPEFIKIKNNRNGYQYYLPDNNFFKNTDLSECEAGSVVRE